MTDQTTLTRAQQNFATLRSEGASRPVALAVVTARYGVSAEAVLRAQEEADTLYATPRQSSR